MRRKAKRYTFTNPDRSRGLQGFEAPGIFIHLHVKVARLSVLTGRLFPTLETPGTEFC
jgi:hypothetical protein